LISIEITLIGWKNAKLHCANGGLVQLDGNRGRRSVIPVLWQGGSVVDRFEVKKTSEGGSPELSTVLLAGDGEPVTEARARG
jgi:hypothetical protein